MPTVKTPRRDALGLSKPGHSRSGASRRSRKQLLARVAIGAIPLISARFAEGTARSYTGVAGGDFSTVTNYSGGAVAAGDSLTFNKAGLGTLINTNAASLTLVGVAFDTNVGSLTIGSTTGTGFTLSNGGTVSLQATLAAGTYNDTLNTPITLAGASSTTGGAGSFLNNTGALSGQLLIIGGPISTTVTSGTITLNLGGTNTGNNTVSGPITQSNTGLFVINKVGTGTWVDSATNSFNGTIQVAAGQLTLSGTDTTGATTSASNVTGGTLALSGTTTVGSINLTGGNIAASGTNTFGGVGSFSGGSFTSTGIATFSSTLGVTNSIVNASGPITFSGAVTETTGGFITTSGAATFSSTLSVGSSIFAASGTTAFAGAVTVTTGGSLTVSGPLSGAGALTVSNNGTATLSGTNGYTGAISVNGGSLTLSGIDTAAGVVSISGATGVLPFVNPTLTLDFTAGQASILNSAKAITVGDGTLAFRGTGTQVVAGLTLGGTAASNFALGSSTLSSTGTSITRTTGGTTFIDESGGGTFKTAITTAQVLGYAAVKDSTGAIGLGSVSATGGVTRLVPTATLVSGAGQTGQSPNTAASNYATSGTVNTTGSLTINSLTINSAAAGTLDLGGGTLIITGSGLVNTGSSPFNIQNGTLSTNFNGGELVVDQFSTGLETISANVGGIGALTKAGTGALLISASNNFTGAVTVNGGTLIAGRSTVLPVGAVAGYGAFGTGTTSLTVNPSGALDVNGNTVAFAGVGGSGTITNNSASIGTIAVNTTNGNPTITPFLTDGVTPLGGVGQLVLSIPTTSASQTMLASSNSFTGGIILGGGVLSSGIQLRISNPAALGSGTIVLNGGNFLPNTLAGVITNPFFVNPVGGFINNQQGYTFAGAFYGTGVIATNGSGGGLKVSGNLSAFNGTFDLENTNGNRSNQFIDLFGSAATTGGTTKFILQSSTASPGAGGAGGSRIEYIGTGNATIPLGYLSGSVFGVVQDSTASTTPITTATYKVGGLNLSSTFAGVFEDNDGGQGTNEGTLVTTSNTALEKTGTGVLNLTSASDYTGATIIDSGGVLLENGTFASGGSFVANTTAGDRTYVLTTSGSTSGFVVGSRVSGVGIIPNSVVDAVTSTTVTLSQGLINGGGNLAATVTDTGGSSLPATSNLQMNGGVLGLGGYGNFTRALGTAAGQVQFTGNGGFAAYTADRTVNIGGASASLVYGTTANFLGNGSLLILGAAAPASADFAAADHAIIFQNGLDFGGNTQTIEADRGTGPVDGILAGPLVNGALTKTGLGILQVNGVNTYTGDTNINAGTLAVDSDTTSTGATGASGASLASININVNATGANLHLISSTTAGNGGSPGTSVSMLSSSAAVTLNGTGTLVSLDLNGAVQTIATLTINGANLAPGYYGSSTFFLDTATTNGGAGYTDADNTNDGYFSGDGGLLVTSSTPEPGSLSLLAIGGMTLLRRRRRNRIAPTKN